MACAGCAIRPYLTVQVITNQGGSEMDPLTASITIILGKYALDRGGEFAKEVGPKALDTAKEMFTAVLDRLRKNPKGAVLAEGFEQDPATYEKPVEKEVEKEAEADAEFKAQLEALLAQFEEQAQAHAAAAGRTYQITQTGSGGLAVDHSTAAGAGGIAVGGKVRDIHTHDRKEGSE
jgi:hypothetical protein